MSILFLLQIPLYNYQTYCSKNVNNQKEPQKVQIIIEGRHNIETENHKT